MASKRHLPNARRVGEQLKRLREAQGLTMAALADKVGFTQQQISKVELGEVNTPIETLVKIAEGLGVAVRLCPADDEDGAQVALVAPHYVLPPQVVEHFLRLSASLGFVSEKPSSHCPDYISLLQFSVA